MSPHDARAAVAVRPAWRPGTVRSLLDEATAEVLAMTPHAAGGVVVQHLQAVGLRAGVRYRLVVPDALRTTPGIARQVRRLTAGGAAVRTLPMVPMTAVIVDRTVAVLGAGDAPGHPLALRLPDVVLTAAELFERLWQEAVPMSSQRRLDGPPDLSRREREVLRLMSTGVTDEVAAARLGCSVRTVRRLVARMMDRVGARSRFQAGIKITERGWLIVNRSG